jgi:SM-20-related protein
VDLERMPTTVTVRRYAQASDGNIHTDSWTKIITALVYFNPDWPHESGALRLLRSPTDIEDYAVEVPPLSGTLIAFRRNECSFHGHKPFEGERRMLQMSWVRPTSGAALALRVKRLTTRLLKTLHLDRASNVKID